MNMQEYRAELRRLSTPELVDKMREQADRMRAIERSAGSRRVPLTDDWMARELLAELGSRQLSLDV